MKSLFSISKHEKGTGLVEYVILLGFITLAVIGTVRGLGPKVACIFDKVSNSLPGTSSASTCGSSNSTSNSTSNTTPVNDYSNYVAPQAKGRGDAVEEFCDNTGSGTPYKVYAVGKGWFVASGTSVNLSSPYVYNGSGSCK